MSTKLQRLLAAAMPFACAVLTFAPPTVRAQGDVGVVLHPGSVDFDVAKKTCTLTGSGDNMWAAEDDFQFVSSLL
jgi:hypothetical protein